MLTTRQAADALGVSPRRVAALIQSGDLEAERFGRAWMVDERSVEARVVSPRLRGRPKMGQKNVMNLKHYTLMNRNHQVLDFVYDNEKKNASITCLHEEVAWAPPGVGIAGGRPNPIDLAAWLRRRYMPPLRPEANRLMKIANVSSTDALMFESFGLNLSDQYWFRPESAALDWHDVNFFENEYSPDRTKPLHTPDSSTPGALEKRWERIGGIDYLIKGSSSSDQREPYNELLATKLMSRLLEPSEYVFYEIVDRAGKTCSACPTMVGPDTEFVSASDVAVYAGITEGQDFYRRYLDACERLGVDSARTRLAKMIVCDHVMVNFDRHRGNFGLMRTVESLDGWRIAPLFDNGAGFFSRATLEEMRRARFIWTSNPFEEYPSQQLARVEDLSWYDPSMLEGFADETAAVLGSNPALPPEFAEHAARHVQRQIDALDDVATERVGVFSGA